MATQINLNLN